MITASLSLATMMLSSITNFEELTFVREGDLLVPPQVVRLIAVIWDVSKPLRSSGGLFHPFSSLSEEDVRLGANDLLYAWSLQ